jgi:hypothetical protein
MNDPTAKASLPSITARPSAAEKARFASLADRAGMSESALALLAIRKLLEPEAKRPQPATAASERVAATDRITIRLRPGDGAAIARRAAERGMKPSAYLSALARAHLRENPPLPARELSTLKQGVAILGSLGHALVRLAGNTALAGPDREALRKNLGYTQSVVAALEVSLQDLAKAALIAWESRHE